MPEVSGLTCAELSDRIETFNSTYGLRLEAPTASTANPTTGPPRLSSDEVLRIARIDAERAYRDLTVYRICIQLEVDGWHVDYELKDPRLNGGGPHYVIDPRSGELLSKRYEQ